MAAPQAAAPPVKPEFVLFTSGDCKFCSNFFQKLRSKEELLQKFNVVDINKIQVVPDEIDEIPCVYDGKQVYQGKDAFTWLNKKMEEYLSAANDGLMYSFLDGQEEKVFGNYSFIEQKNGSFGMGQGSGPAKPESTPADPTRMVQMNSNDNKNRSLDALMASRTTEMNSFNK